MGSEELGSPAAEEGGVELQEDGGGLGIVVEKSGF